MLKIKLISRKPARWAAANGVAVAVVTHKPKAPRGQRWELDAGYPPHGVGVDEVRTFRSRREAFGYFENGRKVASKPVYAGGGRTGTKRVR